MNVIMLLADGADAVGGKLYILGGGWSVAGPEPPHMAIALRFELEWDEAEREHSWTMSLVDEDGRPVMCAEHGTHPVDHSGRFHVHRADRLPGVPLEFNTAVNAGTVPVAPGGRYVWQVVVNGRTEEAWRVSFTTRPARVED